MVKDIKYIIKRIIIGTGIAIALMCIKGNFMLQGHALQAISSWQMTAQDSQIDTDTNSVAWYTNTTVFANQGDGELIFTFSLNKITGEPTTPVLAPRFVRAHTGGDSYVCYIGSSTLTNSTHTEGVYSAICPMHLESAGLTSVVVAFQDLPVVNKSLYRVRFNGLFTWKRDTEYTLLDAINNKLNNIGNSDVINNQNNNTQNIINNQNNNTQDVINNQNSNTDKQIESQKVCKKYDTSSISVQNKYLNSSGRETNNSSAGITNYISIDENTDIIPLVAHNSQVAHYCFYNINKSVISCHANNTLVLGTRVTIPSGTSFIRFSINKVSDEPQFNVCRNGNQSIVDSQQDINNSLNDSSVSDPNSDISNMSQKVASNNSITQLLTLPITLFQNVLNNINGSCSSYNLGSLYGHNLTLPCINLESILGSTLWSIIDILISGLFILSFRKKMVDIFNHMSSLNDRGNELE